jgi:hypothetical protein
VGWLRFAIAVYSLVLAACGDNALPLEIHEYPAAWKSAWCRFQERCGLIPSAARCEATTTSALDPALLAAVEAGVATFDSSAANACIEWVEGRDCDPTSAINREPSCLDIIDGTLSDGETCAFGAECISRECWVDDCDEACCAGYCVGNTVPELGRIGDRCRYSACLEGYCDGSTCIPLVSEGGECKWDAQCALGLSCKFSTSFDAPHRCERLPGAGEPCTSQCRDDGQICHSENHVCERARFEGEVCGDNGDCATGLECSADSRCTSTLVTLGQPCGYYDCEAPFVCDYGFSFTCVLPKADGEACRYDDTCASGSCSWSSQACTSEVCW